MLPPPHKILVINVTRIGDTLLTTPALKAITQKWPNAELTVLAHPGRKEVLENLPWIDHVGAIEKKRAVLMARLTWAKKYDLAFVYGHDKTLIDYALRVSRKVIAFSQQDEALNQRLAISVAEPPPHAIHAVDRALLLPLALGIEPSSKRLQYQPTASELAWATQLLFAKGVSSRSPKIGLQVASFPTKSWRDWPVESFLGLCNKVIGQYPDAIFFILGGPEETQRTHWLKGKLGNNCIMLAGSLSLRQTAAIMSMLNVYVGVDTGPTHLMGTFDIPLIGLYHCKLPQRIYGALEHPYNFSLDHPSVSQPWACNEGTPMADISPQMVYQQLIQAISQRLSPYPNPTIPSSLNADENSNY